MSLLLQILAISTGNVCASIFSVNIANSDIEKYLPCDSLHSSQDDGHDTDESDEEYWAKQKAKTAPKKPDHLFQNGTAVVYGERMGTVKR